MKKFVSWFMSIMMAVFGNVTYVNQETKVYDTAKIYTYDSEDVAPDYRDLYQGRYNSLAVNSCRPAIYKSEKATEVDYGDLEGSILKGDWIVAGEEMSYLELSRDLSFTFSGDDTIIAPFDCVLVQPLASSSDGSNMVLTCTINGLKYSVEIDGMYCWWCDMARTPQTATDGTPIWVHTWEMTSTQVFPKGSVLGRANAGKTTLTVKSMSGTSTTNEVSLHEFYTTF